MKNIFIFCLVALLIVMGMAITELHYERNNKINDLEYQARETEIHYKKLQMEVMKSQIEAYKAEREFYKKNTK